MKFVFDSLWFNVLISIKLKKKYSMEPTICLSLSRFIDAYRKIYYPVKCNVGKIPIR